MKIRVAYEGSITVATNLFLKITKRKIILIKGFVGYEYKKPTQKLL